MVLYKILLTISLITVVYSLPFDDSKEKNSTEERGFSVNDIFKQINVILEQNIQSAIGDSSVEIGDNFTSGNKNGGVQITVEKFEYGVDKFPVTFQPDHDDDSLEDDDVVPLEDTTTISPQDIEALTDKSLPANSQSPITVSKEKKLLSDVAEEPILITV
ncbi:unnamed protein product [Chironomus riparius]|uniref:Uncharacterized protein n=1 Tax=Chironomus riparius TaxID=315576 RepID=A0A9P0IRC9_9DIPT|nr:unnamed protein product [Chironomus riparius]